MPSRRGDRVIDRDLLAQSLGRLDAGTRALLDLSLRRAIPDDQVARVLGVEATSIPPRRARGIAQLADMLEVPGPSELAALLIAIPELPEEAWGVPTPVPFAGRVSSARRAKALRRVAVAASPLVAVGAVMAAVVVASSSDHSGSGSGSGAARTGGSTSSPAVTATAPEARHGLPPGTQLTQVRRSPHKKAHHRARHHHSHHGSAAGQHALLTREPAAPQHSVPVAYHPPAAAPQQPKHRNHHHTPAKPKPKPDPSPVQPVSPPAAPQPDPNSPNVQISQPAPTTQVHSGPLPGSGKTEKTPPPQPNLDPPGHGDQHSRHRDGGNCRHSHGGGSSHDSGSSGDSGSSRDSGYSQRSGDEQRHGRSFRPPGLLRKHHGH
jgi:hypothetical protein